MTAPQKLLTADRRVFGAWTSLGHPSIAEIFAHSGVAFIGIDLEHSTISQAEAQRIIAAAQAQQVACLSRVSSPQAVEEIKRLLDSGADGIIVPNVSTPAEIERIIDWCKYPPVGRRGFGVARAQGYGMDFDAYINAWNERSTLVIQIESIQAVEVVDTLLTQPAIDGVMIGPYDISGSLGIPGQLEHPRVKAACARVVAACRQARKACGMQLVDPSTESVAEAFQVGYTFVVLSSDVFILWKWAERMQPLLRAGEASHARPPKAGHAHVR